MERFGSQILPLHLDVTDRAADFAAVKAAHEHFGQLDVIINNAGYGLFGAIKEVTEIPNLNCSTTISDAQAVDGGIPQINYPS